MNAKKKARPAVWLYRVVYTLICVLPAVLTILFYSLRSNTDMMDWAATRVSAPIREVLGLLSSVHPFSLMEVFCLAAGVWIIYYVVKTIKRVLQIKDNTFLHKDIIIFATKKWYTQKAQSDENFARAC